MSRTFPFLIAMVGALLACNRSNDEPQDREEPEPATSKEPAREERAEKAPPAAHHAPAAGSKLMNPDGATEHAPDTYVVKLETTKGDVLIDVHREWAPRGADRFYNLVKVGYFDDVAFFRVVEGFMAQVGINGDPEVNRVWRQARIPDDQPHQSNTRGMVTFATSGPDSRTTQFFINFGDNSNLDSMGFAPFGRVRDMAPIDALYNGYGEGAPRGNGPEQGRVQGEGNQYLHSDFPRLDYIRHATIQ